MNKRLIQRFRSELGRTLKEGRQLAGLSQEFVGKKLRIPRQAVIKYESGKHTMGWIRFVEICQTLGIEAGPTLADVIKKVNGRKS
jgi:transcriptional regulator with XRE-family HTH domain